MAYHLCVDCGGSKTAVAIADAHGAIVARASGGPSNFAYLGLENFIDVVGETVGAAVRHLGLGASGLGARADTGADATEDEDTAGAGVGEDTIKVEEGGRRRLPLPAGATDRPLFASAWLGVSGVDSAAAIARLVPPLTALLGVRPVVANDTHLLASPLGMYDDVSAAIGCVAGTGGIVVSFRYADLEGDTEGEGKEESGKEQGREQPQRQGKKGSRGAALEELGRVGGWGWILGDEGGGFHVGREAVRQILWAADCASVVGGGAQPPSTLRDRVLSYFGVTDVFELLTVVHWPDPLPTAATQSEEEKGAEGGEDAPAYTKMVREKRLSSLAPLVFSAAFEDGDALALSVLAHTTRELADQICVLLRPEADAEDGKAYPVRTVKASETILCFGGSLVGVEAYRTLILAELERRGHALKRWIYVDDAAGTGARALAAASRTA